MDIVCNPPLFNILPALILGDAIMPERRGFSMRTILASCAVGAAMALLAQASPAAEPESQPERTANVVTKLFNGHSLARWQGDPKLWSVQQGAIVGHNAGGSKTNAFLWSEKSYGDFHLLIDVKLEPNDRNAGIQFRSKKIEHEAQGYQADVGETFWGRLYHEGGRGMLDSTDRGEKAVKPGQWNRYEILAVGHYIWTAINGRLSVAVYDPKGELSGKFALQIHSGPEMTVRYKPIELVENPRIELADMNEEQLKKEAEKKRL